MAQPSRVTAPEAPCFRRPLLPFSYEKIEEAFSMPAIASVRIAPGVVIGGAQPVLIMGPCAIESKAHCLRMAKAVQKLGKRFGFPVIFKASFDKANRTSSSSFRGVGLDEGLRILAAVKAATGLPVTTDIHETAQVEPVAKVVDLLQVPAFLCRQTDLIEACARSGCATSVKKGQFLAPNDCRNIVEKFRAAGGRKLVLIERGTTFGYNNLVVDYRGLPQMRELGVPVIFDGTHAVQSPGGKGNASGGDGRFAPPLIRAALAVGCEGIFMEVHDAPAKAPSDGANMIPLKDMPKLLKDLRAIHDVLGRPGLPTRSA
jgi:2-dehydro-3-deoxyphosphooctonate aldolase (KDO 8-P synthase)